MVAGSNIRAAKRAFMAEKVFELHLIKPSHYDDEGYVIQWYRSAIPSNSLAALNGLAADCARRQALGPDVRIEIYAYDETNVRIRPEKIAQSIARAGMGLACLVGVQSNQFPRALDLARRLRAAGAPTAVGGFHVSGCLAMLPELPADIQEMQDLGVSLFAGEAECRLDDVLRDAVNGELKPLYNFMNDLPSVEDTPTPFLPAEVVSRTTGAVTSFDAGRGCPFQCSFCTIINVQGRKSRHRSADDVERIIRENLAVGIHSFFITPNIPGKYVRRSPGEYLGAHPISPFLVGHLAMLGQINYFSHSLRRTHFQFSSCHCA